MEGDRTMSDEMQNKQVSKQNWKKSIVVYLHDIVYLLAVLMVGLLLVFRIVIVSGSSMNDTLMDGDYLLLLSNVFYRDPEPGDIIVLSKDSYDDGSPIVKRVIATEGQTVDIDFTTGTIIVDGVALDEPYIDHLSTKGDISIFPQTVKEGCVFVLGDNRDVSMDSRYPQIGQIDKREILGKAIFLMLPGDPDEQGPQGREFSRMGVIK